MSLNPVIFWYRSFPNRIRQQAERDILLVATYVNSNSVN